MIFCNHDIVERKVYDSLFCLDEFFLWKMSHERIIPTDRDKLLRLLSLLIERTRKRNYDF